MNDRQARAGSFKAPEPISHQAFRKTPGYAALCAEYGIDPAAEWDTAKLPSIEAACDFLFDYDTVRRACSPWTADTVAAYVESLVLLHESDAGAMICQDRWGPAVVITDPLGDTWTLTAQRYDPAAAGLALARHHAGRTSPS